MPIYHATGFEHGDVSAAGGGLFDAVVGAATVVADEFFAGSKSLHCDATAGQAYVQKNTPSGTEQVVQLRMRIPSGLASGASRLLYAPLNGPSLQLVLDNNGAAPVLKIQPLDATATVVGEVTSDPLAFDTTYTVAIKVVVTANPWSIDWTINDVAQTSTSPAIVAGSFAFSSWAHGMLDNQAAAVWGIHLDDVIFADSAADWPLPASSVVGLTVDGRGTHNLDASPSAFLFENDGTSDAAITSTDTTSAGRIDEVPLGSDTQHVKVKSGGSSSGGPGTAVYASGQTTVSGTWTTAANITGASDAAVASVTPSKNGNAVQELTFPLDTTGGVPSGSDITDLQVTVRAKLATASSLYTIDVIVLDGATVIATQTITGLTTALADYVKTFAGLSILPANLKVQVKVKRGNTNTAIVTSIDSVKSLAQAWSGVVTNPAGTEYLEYTFADSAAADDPLFVTVYNAIRNDSGTTANSITAKVTDDAGTSTTDVYTGLDIASATTVYKSLRMTTPPSGGSWTIAKLNALALRWGFTTNPASTPRLEGAMIEAVIPDPVSTLTLQVGAASSPATVQGATLTPQTATVGAGKPSDPAAVQGANVAGSGSATVSAGAPSSPATVHGANVETGAAQLSAGKISDPAAAQGADLSPSGAAPLTVGKPSSPAVAQGVSPLPQLARLSLGSASAPADAMGVDLTPAVATISVGAPSSPAVVRGVAVSSPAIARVGSVSSPATVAGVSLEGAGAAELQTAAVLDPAVVQGVDVAAAGAASVTAAAVSDPASAQGADLAATGAATLAAGAPSQPASASGIDLRVGVTVLSVGKASSPGTVSGAALTATNAGRISASRVTSPAAARGQSLAGIGVVGLSTGFATSAATARGITLRPAPITLTVGKISSPGTVNGATTRPGTATMSVGRPSSPASAVGSTLTATGTAPLTVSAVTATAAPAGVRLAGFGTATVDVAGVVTVSVLHGASIRSLSVADIDLSDFALGTISTSTRVGGTLTLSDRPKGRLSLSDSEVIA